jgi:predicted ester cyclase
MAFQLYRIANDQLAEHWEVADVATLMRQLEV